MAFDSIDLISANADVPFSNIITKFKTNFQFKLKNAQCSYFIFQKFEIEKKKELMDVIRRHYYYYYYWKCFEFQIIWPL